jgi:hypothetical protein
MGLTNCNTFKILMTYLEEVNLCIIQLLVFLIIIGTLALVAFCARFFGGVFLKRNNHLLTKKKNKLFIYLFIFLLLQHAILDGFFVNFI